MIILDRNPIARSMLRTLLEPRLTSLRFAAGAGETHALIAEAPASHLLVDEATLKAGEGDPMETLAQLVAAIAPGNSAVLWTKPDAEIRAQLVAAGIDNIVEKPVSGAALIAAVVPEPEENLNAGRGDRLVSQAA
jgi:DNA-binding NarL/FixJ family response regulator